nr:MAG TPA: hypothetical protein [Bacteriophage sp.]
MSESYSQPWQKFTLLQNHATNLYAHVPGLGFGVSHNSITLHLL